MNSSTLQDTVATFLETVKNSNEYLVSSYSLNPEMGREYLLLEAETGGYTGGNCWNDNPSHPYSKEEYQVVNELAESLQYRLEELCDTLNVTNGEEIAQQLAQASYYNPLDQKTVAEYYGNSTESTVYGIAINSIFARVLSAPQFSQFHTLYERYKVAETNQQELDEYTQKERNLELALSNIETLRSQEKAKIEREIARLQGSLKNFDQGTENIKNELANQLKDIRGALAGKK